MPNPILLIYPPISKACEPPPGLASIAGSLAFHNIPCNIIDLNIESIQFLLGNKPATIEDTWTKRAYNNIHKHFNSLRDFSIYQKPDSYTRAVKDINRILEMSSHPIKISLTNYYDPHLSPIRSLDLLESMNVPEINPLYQFWYSRLNDYVTLNKISGVGISINFLNQAICGFSVIGIIKRLCSDIPVWVGGGLITSWLKRYSHLKLFNQKNIYFVSGPGEPYLLDFFNVKTNYYIQLPNYDHIFHNQYLSPGFILPYSASRGCYWRKCAFCPEYAEKTRYVPLSKNLVLQHLNGLVKRYQPSLIHFVDNALSPKLLKEMIHHSPNVPWYGFSRITKHLTDPYFCHGLKQSGCVMLKLGIESGDQNVLSHMNKGIDVSLAKKALQTIHESGIATYTYFLFGTPYETENSFYKTINFLCDNCQWIDFANLAIFNLPKHSADLEQLNIRPFYDGDLSLYVNFEHPFGLNRKKIRGLIKHIKSHPVISEIVKNNPLFFTSNHAPFFLFRNA